MTFLFNWFDLLRYSHLRLSKPTDNYAIFFSNGIQRDDFFGITSGRIVVDAVVCATSKGTFE